MQLYLPFDYQESPKKPLTEQDFLHISEFEQGNFSNLICSRFTAEEIATILLQSETTLPDLKKTLLKQRCFNVRRLDVELNEKYKEYVKIHNDRVRTMLRKQYASEDPSRLADR